MATKRPLNARNLEALGAERLAELLIQISKGRTVARRLLRLELAGREGPAGLAHEVRQRLAAIGRSRSAFDAQKRRDLLDELELHRAAIVERIAGEDPAEALDLMWQYMGLANPILDRCWDGDDTFASAFDVSHLGNLASAAGPDPRGLADRAFEQLTQNAHGQYDDLLRVLTPALSQDGLEHLKQLMVRFSEMPTAQLPEAHRPRIQRRYIGTALEDPVAEGTKLRIARSTLQDIADAQGDVDAFIEQVDEDSLKDPAVAAAIARRLLAARRAEEALDAADAAEPDDDTIPSRHLLACEDTRIEALDELGRSDEAQERRWSCFERYLSAPHLRAYLKRLPDFEDFEAEQKALGRVRQLRSPVGALSFLIAWPDLDRAAALVIEEAANLGGVFDQVLLPAADALAARHPLAATLALRAVIEHALNTGHTLHDRHVARHLLDCSGLGLHHPGVRRVRDPRRLRGPAFGARTNAGSCSATADYQDSRSDADRRLPRGIPRPCPFGIFRRRSAGIARRRGPPA